MIFAKIDFINLGTTLKVIIRIGSISIIRIIEITHEIERSC